MTESFMAWMKVGVIAGLTIAAPWIFWQIWIFVAEGLYPSERKYVYIYLPFSLALFFAGASLAYFFVFDPVLGFLLSSVDSGVVSASPSLSARVSAWESSLAVGGSYGIASIGWPVLLMVRGRSST